MRGRSARCLVSALPPLPLLALAGLLLAGCGAPAALDPSTDPLAEGNRMVIGGFVESETLVGLPGATVLLGGTNLTQTTDWQGNFRFPPLEPRAYPVEVRLAGYRTQTLVAQPGTNEGSLDFVMVRDVPRDPYQRAEHARGILECAAQAVAVSGSCDDPAGTPVLQNLTTFPFAQAANWRTLVLDLAFDPQSNPGLDGLVMIVRGRDGSTGIASTVGRFSGSTSFTTRLEPGALYPGGDAPITANTTALQVTVEPRGYLADASCAAGQAVGQCPGGVGVGLNVQFDLYVTSFYVTPAPDGFTLRPTG